MKIYKSSNWPANRISVLVMVFLLAVLATGCATSFRDSRRLNVWPLFNYEKDRGKESVEFDALGPFFTLKSNPKEKEYGFRPFFYVRRNEEARFREVEYLFPFGKYRRRDKERASRFVPLFSSHKDLTEDSSDFGLFPVFWGKDEEGRSYGGLFPIYGRLNSRFGKDQIRFFLWPVYSDSKEEDSWTYNVLWRLFSYTRGKDESGFSVWPLYGHREKEGEYSKYFVLWPIFFSQKTDLDTDIPKKFIAVLPLFAKSSSPGRYSVSFLWPFFNYVDDKRNNYKQWDIPWPIFHYGRGEGLKNFRLFPFYEHKTKPDSKRGFFLWPIYIHRKDIFEDHDDTTFRFLLINKYQKKVWRGGSEDAKCIRVWPLFYYDRKVDGVTRFSFPELIPIEDEGFERNWAPLFRLYEYNKDVEDNMESTFLWGLYKHKRNDSKEFFDVTFLAFYEKEKDMVCFSVLKGLFEYRRVGGAKTVRLFYIPWR